MKCIMLTYVLLLLEVASLFAESSKKEGDLGEESHSSVEGGSEIWEPLSNREGRFFFGGLANNRLAFRDESNERMISMKSRIESLLMKITDFEKLRAKATDADKLLKLIEILSNICPPNTNSLRVGDKCFEHVTTHWMDYDSASVYCKSRGGALARPDLHDDKYLDKMRHTFPSLGDNSVLVGITDILQEGHFTDSDGRKITPKRFYGGTFPVNADKDCVSLIYGGRYCLTDTQCKRLHEVLCEYRPKSLLKEVDPHKHFSF